MLSSCQKKKTWHAQFSHPTMKALFGLNDFHRILVRFLPIGIFSIKTLWFKGIQPPKILWIGFLHPVPVGILARGLTSWKNFHVFMTIMAYTNSYTRFLYFFYAATKQIALLIPVFRILVGFNTSWHHIPTFFLFVCFTIPMVKRGPKLALIWSTATHWQILLAWKWNPPSRPDRSLFLSPLVQKMQRG